MAACNTRERERVREREGVKQPQKGTVQHTLLWRLLWHKEPHVWLPA